MKCIICGNKTWKYLYGTRDRMFGASGDFSELKCLKCGLIRLNPKPSPGELKKYYPAQQYYSYQPDENSGLFARLRTYLIVHLYAPTILSRVLGLLLSVPAMPHHERGKILDIGCGSGETLAQLMSVGWQVYGLDIDANAITSARKRGIQHASVGTYRDLSKYPDGFFDAIRLYHVIEHLDNPELCLSLVYRKLKNGGEVIIGTPNADSLIAGIAKQYWYNLDAPRHLYIFSPKILTVLAKRVGFKPKKLIFCSAWGWVGSLQYKFEEILSRDIDLINRPLLVLLFYPLEWILDKFGIGDVFTIYADK